MLPSWKTGSGCSVGGLCWASLEDLYPGCRCYRIEQHLVLYEVDEEEIRVARFLHKRMDVKRHP